MDYNGKGEWIIMANPQAEIKTANMKKLRKPKTSGRKPTVRDNTKGKLAIMAAKIKKKN
jgi:hypothetical protein